MWNVLATEVSQHLTSPSTYPALGFPTSPLLLNNTLKKRKLSLCQQSCERSDSSHINDLVLCCSLSLWGEGSYRKEDPLKLDLLMECFKISLFAGERRS